MFIKQLEVGHMAVFAYIVGDPDSVQALVIDPAVCGLTEDSIMTMTLTHL